MKLIFCSKLSIKVIPIMPSIDFPSVKTACETKFNISSDSPRFVFWKLKSSAESAEATSSLLLTVLERSSGCWLQELPPVEGGQLSVCGSSSGGVVSSFTLAVWCAGELCWVSVCPVFTASQSPLSAVSSLGLCCGELGGGDPVLLLNRPVPAGSTDRETGDKGFWPSAMSASLRPSCFSSSCFSFGDRNTVLSFCTTVPSVF